MNVWPKLYFDALNVWGGKGGFINTMLTLYIYMYNHYITPIFGPISKVMHISQLL